MGANGLTVLLKTDITAEFVNFKTVRMIPIENS